MCFVWGGSYRSLTWRGCCSFKFVVGGYAKFQFIWMHWLILHNWVRMWHYIWLLMPWVLRLTCLLLRCNGAIGWPCREFSSWNQNQERILNRFWVLLVCQIPNLPLPSFISGRRWYAQIVLNDAQAEFSVSVRSMVQMGCNKNYVGLWQFVGWWWQWASQWPEQSWRRWCHDDVVCIPNNNVKFNGDKL